MQQVEAVDIDADHNPNVSPGAWAYLEKLTGKGKIDTSRHRWETDPEALYDDVADLSCRWRTIVDGRIRAAELANRFAGAIAPTALAPPVVARLTPAVPPLPKLQLRPIIEDEKVVLDVVKDVPDMPNAIKLASANGLMAHERDLAIELRAQGLVWGITFHNRDLHHFEVPSTPLAAWSRPAVPDSAGR